MYVLGEINCCMEDNVQCGFVVQQLQLPYIFSGFYILLYFLPGVHGIPPYAVCL